MKLGLILHGQRRALIVLFEIEDVLKPENGIVYLRRRLSRLSRCVKQAIANGTYETPEKLSVTANRLLEDL